MFADAEHIQSGAIRGDDLVEQEGHPVRIPDGRLFAITVFVMQDHKGQVTRDRIMAEAARATYDYFLFATDRGPNRSTV